VNQSSTPADRRRRLVTRALPLAVVALVAFVVGITAGSPGSPEKDAAGRFAQAWAAKNFRAMYAELNEASRARVSRKEFEAAYREAQETATVRGVDAGTVGDSSSNDAGKLVPVAMTIRTVAFGTVEGDLEVPYADGGVEWDESLVFPGLRRGEELAADVELAERAPILARDGTPRSTSPGKSAKRPKKSGRSWRATGSLRKPRSGSAASSSRSTRASPASPAASCSRSRQTGPRSAPSPRASRGRARR
jgi:hypothetical protein